MHKVTQTVSSGEVAFHFFLKRGGRKVNIMAPGLNS
jgi:hypothetical protein